VGRLKLDQEALGLISSFEKVAQVPIKDCFREADTIYFVVSRGEIGKALGKGGINVKRFQESIQKRIRLIEFDDDLCTFVRNIIYPLSVQEIKQEGGVVYIKDQSKKTKSLLIGREGKNLQITTRAIKRFFDVEVKII